MFFPLIISFTNSFISFQSQGSNKYPYIRNVIPVVKDNDEEIEIVFRFTSSGPNFGAGIALTDDAPAYGASLYFPQSFITYTIFYLWHDPVFNLHFGTSLCSVESEVCPNGITFFYKTLVPDLNLHKVNIRRNGDLFEGRGFNSGDVL